ncbi:MAG: hypothetical protein AB2693_21445, partial [Candidatus Thiodiazotropha sp.]
PKLDENKVIKMILIRFIKALQSYRIVDIRIVTSTADTSSTAVSLITKLPWNIFPTCILLQT